MSGPVIVLAASVQSCKGLFMEKYLQFMLLTTRLITSIINWL